MRYRIASAVMTLCLLLSLCACGGNAEASTTTSGVSTAATADVATTTAEIRPTQNSTDGSTTATDVTDSATPDVQTTTATTGTTTSVSGNKTFVSGSPNILTLPVAGTTAATTEQEGDQTVSVTAVSKTTTARKNYTNTLASVKRDEKYKNDTGIYHILKGYCFGRVFRTAEWLSVVGYVKNGEVLDSMYEATTIMPSPGNVYWSDFGTKEKWDEWVEHTLINLDTLNRAAGQVQDALKLKEYKVKVFPTLVNPHNAKDNPNYYDNWGALNGVTMDVDNNAHRLQMVKYLIDTYIRVIREKQYNNIELVGFYWFDEYIDGADLAWYNDVTDYVRSKGLLTMISPYYRATGWQLCDEAGFDIHSMQSNYFPNGTLGILNCGPVSRLNENAALINNGEIGGIEMELDDHGKKDGITGWKQTLKVGIETGIVNGYHLHYFGNGPGTPVVLASSNDPYYRSAYDETYLYMKNKLKVSDIWLDPIEKPQERA